MQRALIFLVSEHKSVISSSCRRVMWHQTISKRRKITEPFSLCIIHFVSCSKIVFHIIWLLSFHLSNYNVLFCNRISPRHMTAHCYKFYTDLAIYPDLLKVSNTSNDTVSCWYHTTPKLCYFISFFHPETVTCHPERVYCPKINRNIHLN